MLGTRALCGREATKLALEQCESPIILHAATHAFCAQDPLRAVHSPGDPPPPRALDNPLLRCGLLLAGAENWRQGRMIPPEVGNGILTAEDVTGLALIDTEMIVLSACQTGLGKTHAGEGVFGFRRSFVIAGARTLVLSLWKVDDRASHRLMVKFYENLKVGMGRADALHVAKLAVREQFPHPSFWGAFICQGDPAALSRRAFQK